ncbi:MAG: hypothetical protein ABIU09_09915 [Pyrinomonadaceae bacterium]
MFGQADMKPMFDAEKAFVQSAAEKGIKSAFLEILAGDSIIFHPEAVNGREYWSSRTDSPASTLVRAPKYGDISSNGVLGYTMGNWRLYPKGKSEDFADFGQYVTIWEKRGSKFLASLDIGITHEKLPSAETDHVWRAEVTRDPNKLGWSPADASMNFLKMSMSEARLGSAYKKFADDDVRLLIEREPPILGKKNVVRQTNRYISVEFPKKVALFQAADMAYTWNACQYANSTEGVENGNCLHIWKLRNKKWLIVLGVFARVSNDTAPTLKVRQKSKKSR